MQQTPLAGKYRKTSRPLPSKITKLENKRYFEAINMIFWSLTKLT